jgi:hypothetical protein
VLSQDRSFAYFEAKRLIVSTKGDGYGSEKVHSHFDAVAQKLAPDILTKTAKPDQVKNVAFNYFYSPTPVDIIGFLIKINKMFDKIVKIT